MSWIVQSLLNSQESIKEMGDISSDEFNDLIIIERAIDKLMEEGLLDNDDLKVIEDFRTSVLSDKSKHKPENASTHFRHHISSEYANICNRIAFYLGGYFTDDGYLHYMQNKYNLSNEQVEVLRNYIRSSYRHKIVRKISPNGYKRNV